MEFPASRGNAVDTAELHLFAGWIATGTGVVAGAVIGLGFHEEEWAGGYGSWSRRMLRLGHISLFGIGFLNLLFGFTLRAVSVASPQSWISSLGFLVGLIAMPSVCFLSAWRKPFRHLFPIPVLSVLVGIVSLLLGWSST
jgi:hypothetical protein